MKLGPYIKELIQNESKTYWRAKTKTVRRKQGNSFMIIELAMVS
jgi:hypothetical protein